MSRLILEPLNNFRPIDFIWLTYIGSGMPLSAIRAYIDGNCDYAYAGGHGWLSISTFDTLPSVATVVLHIMNGCSGTLYIYDAKNRIILHASDYSFSQGIYVIQLEIPQF